MRSLNTKASLDVLDVICPERIWVFHLEIQTRGNTLKTPSWKVSVFIVSEFVGYPDETRKTSPLQYFSIDHDFNKIIKTDVVNRCLKAYILSKIQNKIFNLRSSVRRWVESGNVKIWWHSASARVSHHCDQGSIPAPRSYPIKATLVTCVKCVDQFKNV